MTIHYEVTEKHYVNFNTFHMRKAKSGKIFLAALYAISLALVLRGLVFNNPYLDAPPAFGIIFLLHCYGQLPF